MRRIGQHAKQSMGYLLNASEEDLRQRNLLEKEKEKSPSGRSKNSRWGNLQLKCNKSRMLQWVASIESVDKFTHSQAGLILYKGLSAAVKCYVRKRLRSVDPEGLKRLTWLLHRHAADMAARKKREEVVPELTENDVAAMEEVAIKDPAVTKFRFVPMEGVSNLLALALAAGYKREEVAAMAGLDTAELVHFVTMDDVNRMKKEMPDAIVNAANQKVMRDFLVDGVDENTERADRIAARRLKLKLDASAEVRELRREHGDLQERREKHLRSRFGVDRKTGEAIDVEATEEKEEEST